MLVDSAIVDWHAWRRVDAMEIAAGERVGKPREKLTTWPALVAAAAAVPGAASAT